MISMELKKCVEQLMITDDHFCFYTTGQVNFVFSDLKYSFPNPRHISFNCKIKFRKKC